MSKLFTGCKRSAIQIIFGRFLVKQLSFDLPEGGWQVTVGCCRNLAKFWGLLCQPASKATWTCVSSYFLGSDINSRKRLLPKTPLLKSCKIAQMPLGKWTLFIWPYFSIFGGVFKIESVEFMRHYQQSLKCTSSSRPLQITVHVWNHYYHYYPNLMSISTFRWVQWCIVPQSSSPVITLLSINFLKSCHIQIFHYTILPGFTASSFSLLSSYFKVCNLANPGVTSQCMSVPSHAPYSEGFLQVVYPQPLMYIMPRYSILRLDVTQPSEHRSLINFSSASPSH